MTGAERLRRALRALTHSPEPGEVTEEPALPEVPRDLPPLMRELGAALLSSGQSVVDIEAQLAAVASAYGAHQVRVFVLPTGVFLQVDSTEGTVTDVTGPRSSTDLPMHQVGAVESLVRRLSSGTADLAQARVELRRVLASPPRFGPIFVVLGHALLTLGFGLILYPTVDAFPVYIGLGALVGFLRLLATRWPTLETVLPVFAAFLVSILTIEFIAPHVGGNALRLLTPALIAFLPGLMLAVAAIELTSNQVVAGASRMVYGIAQLLLLAFGVVVAISITGAFETSEKTTLAPWWAGLAGVVLAAIGYRYFASTPPGAFWWVLGAMVIAYCAQAAGSALLTTELGGFVGALFVAPVAQAISRTRNGPPAVVVTQPAFWMLVPGALGFRSVSELATGQSLGVTDMISTGIALFSIALGVLVGSALTGDARRMRARMVRASTRRGVVGDMVGSTVDDVVDGVDGPGNDAVDGSLDGHRDAEAQS